MKEQETASERRRYTTHSLTLHFPLLESKQQNTHSQLLPADASEAKRLSHPAALRREIDVLRRLRGGLNVASLEDAFEDAAAVHLVLEHCAGGELAHALGARHYSERTAASYMRAVLRTLAQCHAAGILHRDVKPGNFMLLSDDARAPLKAVDFGLAAFFDPSQPNKPREDLGLEGTPWYLAPEVLSSKVGPEADLWAAGVMAYQLLTGRFPFDDRAGYGTGGPVLSRVWRSILTDKLRTDGPAWEGAMMCFFSFFFFVCFRERERAREGGREGGRAEV